MDTPKGFYKYLANLDSFGVSESVREFGRPYYSWKDSYVDSLKKTETKSFAEHAKESEEIFHARLKKIIKAAHPKLSEPEIDKIMVVQERFADILFDTWLTKRNKKIA